MGINFTRDQKTKFLYRRRRYVISCGVERETGGGVGFGWGGGEGDLVFRAVEGHGVGEGPLIRSKAPLGPNSKTLLRAPWWCLGGRQFIGGGCDLVFGAVEGHGVGEGQADVGNPLGLGGVCSLLQLRAHRL